MDGRPWEQNQGVVIDDNAETMKLETLNGELYLFDIRTGKILSASRPMRFRVLLTLAVLLPFYLFYLYRASFKPDISLWKSLKRIFLISLMLVFVLALFSLGLIWLSDFLPQMTTTLQWLESLLLTLFQLPEIALPPGAGHSRVMIVWIPFFWFVVFSLTGVFNSVVIRFSHLIRQQYSQSSSKTN
jgi:ABC-type multidrug transport system fused ATPase/permease subunit